MYVIPKKDGAIPTAYFPFVFFMMLFLSGCALSRTFQPGSLSAGSPHFVEGTIIGIAEDNPKTDKCVFFVNTTTPLTVKQFPPNQWNVIDCSALVPKGTKAVALTSLLIITHGKQLTLSNLTLSVRRHGSEVESFSFYHAQAVASSVGSGERVPDTIWVAVSHDMKFEVYWTKTDEPEYPQGSAYGINMCLFAYLR